jgi:hypothetical protein
MSDHTEQMSRARHPHALLITCGSTAETIPAWQAMNGQQAGDPAKLARALIQLADIDDPPLRWVAGEDAVEDVEEKARLLLAQVDAHRELSINLAHDDAHVAA